MCVLLVGMVKLRAVERRLREEEEKLRELVDKVEFLDMSVWGRQPPKEEAKESPQESSFITIPPEGFPRAVARFKKN